MFGIFKYFDIIFVIVFIIVIVGFIFTILMMFSPKLKAKFMEKQIKATKYMMEDNEDNLTDIARRGANISKEGVEITANAIKRGLTDEKEYCKHCGTLIDKDSMFCKKCGKKQ